MSLHEAIYGKVIDITHFALPDVFGHICLFATEDCLMWTYSIQNHQAWQSKSDFEGKGRETRQHTTMQDLGLTLQIPLKVLRGYPK